jgi:hypothetical protein
LKQCFDEFAGRVDIHRWREDRGQQS